MAHPIRVCQHLLKMQTSAGFELGSSEQKKSTPTTCTVLQLFDQGAILSTYISVSCTIPFHVCILFHWKEGEQCDQIRRFIGLTLDNCLKSLATIKLPKSPTFLGNFCKGVKSYHFSSEIIFRQLLQAFGDSFWSLSGREKHSKFLLHFSSNYLLTHIFDTSQQVLKSHSTSFKIWLQHKNSFDMKKGKGIVTHKT